MIGIYKITSPQEKIYIGQSIDIERRFKEYNKMLCNQSKKLFFSFKKYGVQNHKFEILEECYEKDLNEREEYYIKFFNSIKKGLNIKLGSKPSWTGKKRPNHSKFLKENGSGFNYTRTDKHKEHMSEVMKKVWSIKRDSIIEKIKNNKIGKKTKAIICHENGMIFKSINECSQYMKISAGNICSFVKGKYPYDNIRGFTFSYFEINKQ